MPFAHTFDLIKIQNTTTRDVDTRASAPTDVGVVFASGVVAWEYVANKRGSENVAYGWERDGRITRARRSGSCVIVTDSTFHDFFAPVFRAADITHAWFTLDGEVVHQIFNGHLDRQQVMTAILTRIGYMLSHPEGAD